ncbi:gp220 [Bacillus phage W.Ph.]|uniref:Gp220 n=1 Tax=Bacillus phage W.Ph. TaxID=764595 RepID=G9B1X1_9CAUD|nr:gp220 [Bacillus phage W.Ph.]ADH03366.1 gp220 [Bacillus phage W.Ph.]
MSKRKIKFPCMYNEYTPNQDDYLIVKETSTGLRFKIKDKYNVREIRVDVPLLNAMEIRVVIQHAMIGTIDKEFDLDDEKCVWVRDSTCYSRPAVSILLADLDDSESICITTHQANQLYDFIKEVYDNVKAV